MYRIVTARPNAATSDSKKLHQIPLAPMINGQPMINISFNTIFLIIERKVAALVFLNEINILFVRIDPDMKAQENSSMVKPSNVISYNSFDESADI